MKDIAVTIVAALMVLGYYLGKAAVKVRRLFTRAFRETL